MPIVKKQTNHKTTKKHGSSVVDRIGPVSLANSDMKINIYGRSGTGKTTLACTFPKPLLLIGAEDGTRSVHNVNGVDFVPITTSGELTELTEYVIQSDKYKTVVLDTASSLQDMILKEIMGIDELPAQKSWGMASRDQYGQCSLQTKERLRALLNLKDCNVVILAQEREFNTESDGSLLMPYTGSALTPSVTGWLNPACDYICQTFIRQRTELRTIKIGKKVSKKEQTIKGVDFCLRVAPDPVFMTKFRLPKGTELPEFLIDPNYEAIDKLIWQ